MNFIPAKTWAEFQTLRSIRNECRQWMTNDQRILSSFHQWRFWFSYRYRRQPISIFLAHHIGKPVGYGIIRQDAQGKPWITGGLRETYRGQGLGRELFEFLTQQANPKPALLAALCSNHRAITLYSALGWVTDGRHELGKYGHVLFMRHEGF